MKLLPELIAVRQQLMIKIMISCEFRAQEKHAQDLKVLVQTLKASGLRSLNFSFDSFN